MYGQDAPLEINDADQAASIGLKAILRFNIHNLVPFEEGTTFRQLAAQTGLPEKKLTRLLRSAMTEHLFREPSPGHVKHTIATKALVKVPRLATWAQMIMQDIVPAQLRVCNKYNIPANAELDVDSRRGGRMANI